MYPPMRKIEKERSVAVLFNHLDRFVGIIVCNVSTRLKTLAPVKRGGKLHRRPQKAVDRVKILFGIHNVGIIHRQIKPTRHQQTVIKTLLVRGHTVRPPQMPLADMSGVIAGILQHFCNRDFRSGHAQILIRPNFI